MDKKKSDSMSSLNKLWNWKLNDEPKFNDVFSRDKLPKTIEKRAYVIDLSEYTNIGTHSIALFCRKTEIVYFDSFGIEEINIFRVQASNSIMCGYIFIGFIYFMQSGKKLTYFPSLFSPCNIKKAV